MIPKVGDTIRLNPDFLKIFFKKYTYFGEEVWKENFLVTEIKSINSESLIKIEYELFKYYVCISYNGESSNKELKGVQVFIPANIPKTKDNNIYCSCNGPIKENWVLGERFYICTICRKERI